MHHSADRAGSRLTIHLKTCILCRSNRGNKKKDILVIYPVFIISGNFWTFYSSVHRFRRRICCLQFFNVKEWTLGSVHPLSPGWIFISITFCSDVDPQRMNLWLFLSHHHDETSPQLLDGLRCIFVNFGHPLTLHNSFCYVIKVHIMLHFRDTHIKNYCVYISDFTSVIANSTLK